MPETLDCLLLTATNESRYSCDSLQASAQARCLEQSAGEAPSAVATAARSSYEGIWRLQQQLQREIISGERSNGVLLICEHSPGVITLGKSADSSHVLVNEEQRRALGVELFEVERGGDVTYHGPGQLTAYPIIDLNLWKRDVGWYLRSLEAVIIQVLAHYGVRAQAIEGHTGVWAKMPEQRAHETVRDTSAAHTHNARAHALKEPPIGYAKIASIGVRLSRWVTMHGFSLNFGDCLGGFDLISGCGYSQLPSTSLLEQRASGHPAPNFFEIAEHTKVCFSSVFDCKIRAIDTLGKFP